MYGVIHLHPHVASAAAKRTFEELHNAAQRDSSEQLRERVLTIPWITALAEEHISEQNLPRLEGGVGGGDNEVNRQIRFSESCPFYVESSFKFVCVSFRNSNDGSAAWAMEDAVKYLKCLDRAIERILGEECTYAYVRVNVN
jgi:hypothetical protein